MATKQSTVDFLTEQMEDVGVIRERKMFGEYAIYCDDQLFVKITDPGRKFLDEHHEAPPYPGAKNYFRVPEEKWDNREWITDFIRQTAAALPIPKPKKKR